MALGFPYQSGDHLTEKKVKERFQLMRLDFSTGMAVVSILTIVNLSRPGIAYAVDTPPSNPGNGVQIVQTNRETVEKKHTKRSSIWHLSSGSYWLGFFCAVIVLTGLGFQD